MNGMDRNEILSYQPDYFEYDPAKDGHNPNCFCDACLESKRLQRETCVRCGMVANIDPSLHTERYQHRPVVRRDGQLYEFDFQSYTFRRPITR